MRISYSLLTMSLVLSAVAARAEVEELDGAEMVDAYVQGISIAQQVVDKKFDADDQSMRESNEDQRNSLGAVTPTLSIANVEALHREPTLAQASSNIEDSKTRDLVEDAITQTSLSTRFDINLDRIAADTGIAIPTTVSQDFSVLRGTVLELLPSATGYQFEFMKDHF